MEEHSKPRHEQIAFHLRREIMEDYFQEGDKLPSEKRLCEYFNVSRITVRRALQTLENESLIYRKQGLGAFVMARKNEQPLVQLTDFSEDLRKAGYEPSSKIISFKKTKSDVTINSRLGLSPTSQLMRLDRIRYANDQVVAYDQTWLPASYGQLLFDEDLESKTIYEILEEKYEIPITAGSYSFNAISADKEIAKHVGVELGTALIYIERCSKTLGNKRVYYQYRYMNPAYITYEIELRRDDSSLNSTKEGMPLKQFVPKFTV
jgi:GntR family transcriptional regulator